MPPAPPPSYSRHLTQFDEAKHRKKLFPPTQSAERSHVDDYVFKGKKCFPIFNNVLPAPFNFLLTFKTGYLPHISKLIVKSTVQFLDMFLHGRFVCPKLSVGNRLLAQWCEDGTTYRVVTSMLL
eukprot:3418120-Amphidinium_carterae.1